MEAYNHYKKMNIELYLLCVIGKTTKSNLVFNYASLCFLEFKSLTSDIAFLGKGCLSS